MIYIMLAVVVAAFLGFVLLRSGTSGASENSKAIVSPAGSKSTNR